MTIDIRDDIPDFLAYITTRVEQQKKDPTPVTRMDFGFEFGQSNWVALVFDTRADAEPDGEWTMAIDDVLLERPKWPKWPKWPELPENEMVYFIDLDGKEVNVMDDPDTLICQLVGEAMKQALLQARDVGAFKTLPKAPKCEMGVENMEGHYGWPNYEERGQENLL